MTKKENFIRPLKSWCIVHILFVCKENSSLEACLVRGTWVAQQFEHHHLGTGGEEQDPEIWVTKEWEHYGKMPTMRFLHDMPGSSSRIPWMLGYRTRVDKSTAQRGLHSASKSMYHQGLVYADSLCCGGVTSLSPGRHNKRNKCKHNSHAWFSIHQKAGKAFMKKLWGGCLFLEWGN